MDQTIINGGQLMNGVLALCALVLGAGVVNLVARNTPSAIVLSVSLFLCALGGLGAFIVNTVKNDAGLAGLAADDAARIAPVMAAEARVPLLFAGGAILLGGAMLVVGWVLARRREVVAASPLATGAR
jgi:hypothetical protein